MTAQSIDAFRAYRIFIVVMFAFVIMMIAGILIAPSIRSVLDLTEASPAELDFGLRLGVLKTALTGMFAIFILAVFAAITAIYATWRQSKTKTVNRPDIRV